MSSAEYILVGGGMANIVAAANLTRAGHKVVLLEQTDRLGGYFTGFTSPAGDRFDLSTTHLLGGTAGQPFLQLLADWGVDATFDPVTVADVVHLRGRRYELPTGLEALESALADQFPGSRAELAAYFDFMRQFMGTSADPKQAGRLMMTNYKRHYREFCETHISDPDLRTLLGIRIQCDDSSLMIMSGFVTEAYGKGMVYPVGGVWALVDRIAAAITAGGGEIRTGCRVTDLVIESDIARGVVLDSGEVVTGDVVLYNGDAARLSATLEPRGHPPLDMAGRKRGHSSLSIFLTLVDADLSRFAGAARHYLTDTRDVFETYEQLETGALPTEPVIKLHFMSRIDPTLAAPGRDLLRIEVDMYHYETGHDETFYEQYAAEVLARAGRLVPEIATHTDYRRVVSPIDYEQMFGHAGGSATGWAHDVQNYMVRRMSQRTGVANVFVTGQWGEYGSGLPQLIQSASKSIALSEQWLRKRVQV